MAEEQGQVNPEQSTPPVKFEDVVVEEPPRDVPGGGGYAPSVTEVEDSAASKTDIQAILGVLTPKFKDKRLNEVLQSVMVSRIFPDNYIDKLRLITINLMEELGPDPDKVDFLAIVSNSQDACSIGFEGRGIIDRLEIAGVVHEQEMEKIAKDAGLV